ncbi:hypothetical protein DRN67_01390 [Candidatus Micrarchaeota archaeon]|nr:MAG: hypothetical protein DRN67_01390 [Candidatus Micrarchaeota archaeon]
MDVDGRVLAFACLLLWSLSPPLAKLGVGEVGFLSFSLFTALLTGLFAFPFMLKEKIKGVRRWWKQLLMLYLFAYFLFSILYFLGIESISAIQGSALLGSEVLFSLLVGAVYGKEKLGHGVLVFTLLLMLGIAVAILNGMFELSVSLGALFVLLAMLSLQLGFYNAADAIRECGVGTILVFGNLFQAAATLLLFPLTSTPLAFAFDPSAWLSIIIYAALPSFSAAYLWYQALKRISVYVTTAIVVPAPAVAILYSVLLLGETITTYHIIGVGLIVLSVWRIANRKHQVRSSFM